MGYKIEDGYNCIFDSQLNIGWGKTFNMTGKAPAINKRIFVNYADAEAYINNPLDTAIEGLVLTVINDETSDALNGAYLVKSVAMPVYNEDGSIKYDDEGNAEIAGDKLGELVKLSDSNIDTSLYKIVEGRVEDISEPLENKIYLVNNKSTGDTGNSYTEYIYVKTGENSYTWEKLGEHKATIKLDDYYKKSETYNQTQINNLLKNKLDVSTDGEISVSGITTNGIKDDSTTFIIGTPETDDYGRSITINDEGISLIVSYPYEDEQGDTQTASTSLTIGGSEGVKVNGENVSLDGHNHDNLYHSKNDVYTKTEVYTREEVEQKISEVVAGDISGQYIPTSAITTGTVSDDSDPNLVASASHNHDGNIVFTNTIAPAEAKVEGEGVTIDSLMPSISIFENNISFNLGDDRPEFCLRYNSEGEQDELLFNEQEIATKKYTDDEIGKLNNIINGLRSLVIEVQGKNTQLQAQLNALEAKAITSITGENSDISATERDENGNVVISLNSITNIAFGDATEIEEENTAQF